MNEITLLPNGLAELFYAVSVTGKLTLADRYGLMAALLNSALSGDEERAINRLLHAISRGRIQIVDDLSTTAYPC